LKKPLLIAVTAAIIFALAVFLFLQGQEATRTVVVAAQDMPVGTVVDKNMLRVVNIPVGSPLGEDVVENVADIIGKSVIIARTEGDLVPLRALGGERMMPHPGFGFITVTVPIQDAHSLVVGDKIAFSVFAHGEGAGTVGDFAVRAITNTDNSSHLLIEGDLTNILNLSPFLAARSFILMRKAWD